MCQTKRCPQCDRPLPPDDTQGLCPACLLKRGLESHTIGFTAEEQAHSRWTPPAVDQLAPLFPELDIYELIGRGGMGAVYKARQKELDRLVALKILPPEIGRQESFAQRFAREAQAMAKLSHPNIVTIHDFGVAQPPPAVQESGGTQPGAAVPQQPQLFFFLMEYVDGLSLRQLLNTGNVAPKEALAIVPQICDALQYAHDRGIVHRDIKPENILLNRAGQVKIADFGLAKLVGRDKVSSVAQPPSAVSSSFPSASSPVPQQQRNSKDTAEGGCATQEVMGTPEYMAPEQVSRPAEVDHRADIYSLGVVFYQMLTGELPTGRFEPPSRKVLIDVRLDEVVLRALEREPDRRYQQASQVRTEVETIVTTPPASPAQQPPGPPLTPPLAPPPLPAQRPWGKWITAYALAIVPSLLTAVLCHLLFFAVMEGGNEFLWGHEFTQAHLNFFHWLAPAMMGAVVWLLLFLHRRWVRVQPWARWLILTLAALVLIHNLPALVLAIKPRYSETLYLSYAVLVALLSLPLWAGLFRRTQDRSSAKPASPGPAAAPPGAPLTDRPGRSQTAIIVSLVLLAVNIALLGVFALLLVPARTAYERLFEQMGAQLPQLTIIVFSLPSWAWWLLAAIAAAALVAKEFLRQKTITLLMNLAGMAALVAVCFLYWWALNAPMRAMMRHEYGATPNGQQQPAVAPVGVRPAIQEYAPHEATIPVNGYALDLDSGEVLPWVGNDPWPHRGDIQWAIDEKGEWMLHLHTQAKSAILPLAEASSFEDATRLAITRFGLLKAVRNESTHLNLWGRQDRAFVDTWPRGGLELRGRPYAAVLTSDGNLAIVQVHPELGGDLGKRISEKVTIRWSLASVTHERGPKKQTLTGNCLTKLPPVSETRWRVLLGWGVKVELLGVARNPMDGQSARNEKWWRPDGKPMAPLEGYSSFGEVALGEPDNPVRFAVRLSGESVGMELKGLSTQPGAPLVAVGNAIDVRCQNSSGAGLLTGKINLPKETRVVAAYAAPATLNRMNIKIGVAAGKWETFETSGPNGSPATRSATCATFKQAVQKGKDVAVDVQHNWRDRQVRVIAITRDGKEITESMSVSVGPGDVRGAGKPTTFPGSVATTFWNVSLKDIKEFRFQMRPFEWVEFTDVELWPEGKSPAPAQPEKFMQGSPLAQPGDPWRVELPSGLEVAFVGVCERSGAVRRWWRPDGKPLAKAPYAKGMSEKPIATDETEKAVEMAIRVSNLPTRKLPQEEIWTGTDGKDVVLKERPIHELTDEWVLDFDKSAWGQGSVVENMQSYYFIDRWEMRVLEAAIPVATLRRHANVRYGVRSGDWVTLAGTDGSKLRSFDGITFSQAYEKDKALHVDVTQPPGHEDDPSRCIAVLKDGKDVRGQSQVMGSWSGKISKQKGKDIPRLTTVSFPGLSLKDVKEIQFQAKPLEWVEFKNVSLRPDAAAPATQPATSAPAGK